MNYNPLVLKIQSDKLYRLLTLTRSAVITYQDACITHQPNKPVPGKQKYVLYKDVLRYFNELLAAGGLSWSNEYTVSISELANIMVAQEKIRYKKIWNQGKSKFYCYILPRL